MTCQYIYPHTSTTELDLIPHVTADSACNAAGLGFSGYDKFGHPQWDLVSSVDIIAIEVSL